MHLSPIPEGEGNVSVGVKLPAKPISHYCPISEDGDWQLSKAVSWLGLIPSPAPGPRPIQRRGQNCVSGIGLRSDLNILEHTQQLHHSWIPNSLAL